MDFLDKRAPSGVLKDVSFLGGGKHAVSCLGFSLYENWGLSHHNSRGNWLCWCHLGPQSYLKMSLVLEIRQLWS